MELTARVHREPDSVWADVAELPGCFASGRDDAELLEALRESVALYLADPSARAPEPVVRALHLVVPPPSG